ncbi:MAG: hypothetical protein AAGI08_02685 [Bacteroidota bacterium]
MLLLFPLSLFLEQAFEHTRSLALDVWPFSVEAEFFCNELLPQYERPLYNQ